MLIVCLLVLPLARSCFRAHGLELDLDGPSFSIEEYRGTGLFGNASKATEYWQNEKEDEK